MIDVDGFKSLNDHHVHLVGDRLLLRVADRLRESLRRNDGLYRFSGDEFIALLPRPQPHCATVTADRLCRAIERLAEQEDLGVTISVGLAALRAGNDPQVVLKIADHTLYQAKRNGRNRAVMSYPTA